MCSFYRYSMVPVLRYGTVHCRLYSTFRYRQYYTVHGTVLYYRYCLYGTVQQYCTVAVLYCVQSYVWYGTSVLYS